MNPNMLIRAAASLAGCALGLALAASPALARTAERGVEPIHQPVVERTDFVFDVAGGGDGALDNKEARRLRAWFDALDLRYGDHVTLAGAQGPAGVRDGVREIVARYGLLTGAEAPATAGDPPAGAVRVVVSRSSASVPSCPTWRDRFQTDFVGGQGDNYGCATATNLAAMAADPQDLVRGRTTDTDLRTATGSRAIKVYQEKTPTGSGGLQSMGVGGN